MVSKKHSKIRVAAIASSLVLAVSAAAAFVVPKVNAANGPCDEGDWAFAYVSIGNREDSTRVYAASAETGTVEGVTYDRSSNTLTLDNYKNTSNYIATNMMGDDFKINLIGDNEVASIIAYGDAWGGSVNITGEGSLVVDDGVDLYAEGTKSVLSVGDKCNVTIYGGESNTVVSTDGNLTDKIIVDNGTLNAAPKYTVTHPFETNRVFACYYNYEPSEAYSVYEKDNELYILITHWNGSGEVTGYAFEKLTKNEFFGDTYILEANNNLSSTIPEGYKEKILDEPIYYYESDGGSGSTSEVVINTATNKKYALEIDWDSVNNKSVYKLCELIGQIGMYNEQEKWLVDYDNPAATLADRDSLPEGYEFDGTPIEDMYNVVCTADKITFTAKSSDTETPTQPDDNKPADDNKPTQPDDNKPADDNKPTQPDTTGKDTVVDVSDGNTVIKAEEILKIIEDNKEKDVVIKSNNDVTFTFEKGTMTQVADATIYDFSTVITSDIKNAGTMPEDVTQDVFVSKIQYNYSGKLPATASIKLNVGKAYSGQTLYYSQLLDDGSIINMMSAVVDGEGYMTVKQDHCSTYLITKQQLKEKTTETIKDNEKETTSSTENTNNTDKKEETPKTADMTPISGYVIILLAAITGICVAFKMAVRTKNN